MLEQSLLLVYEPDPNPTVFGDKDTYRLLGNGRVIAETRFFTNSSTDVDIIEEGLESYQMKQYQNKYVEFELDPETVEEYFTKVRDGIDQQYEKGNQVHVQIGESIGIDDIANISRRTEPISIAEVRRSLGEKGQDELGNPDAFHLE